jgi:integrase
MATIYPKGSRWYIAWGSGPDREAVPLGPEVKTRAEAVAAKRLFEAERVRGGTRIPGLVTFGEAWAAFVVAKRRTAEASTQVYYRTHGAHFARLLDQERMLGAFSIEDVERYTETRAEETSAATANKELGTLRALWRFAMKRRLASGSPVEAVEELRETRAPKAPCTAPILARALKTIRAEIRTAREDRVHGLRLFAAALRLGWHSGLRLGEMCRLRPQDMRWGELSYLVRATRVKGGDRVRPIPKPVVRMLARWTSKGGAFVFFSGSDPERRTSAYSTLRQQRDEFVHEYPELALAGFHSLRHGWATEAARTLKDGERADLLGHATVQRTEGYTHRDLADRRQALDRKTRGRRPQK